MRETKEMEYHDIPPPPWPARDLERIGTFFLTFSVLEQWLCNYLLTHGKLAEGKVRKLTFRPLLNEWRATATHKEPCQSKVCEIYELLLELADKRDSLAHAWWRQRGEGLHGEFLRRRDNLKIVINGSDIETLLEQAKHCEAVLDFWNEPLRGTHS